MIKLQDKADNLKLASQVYPILWMPNCKICRIQLTALVFKAVKISSSIRDKSAWNFRNWEILSVLKSFTSKLKMPPSKMLGKPSNHNLQTSRLFSMRQLQGRPGNVKLTFLVFLVILILEFNSWENQLTDLAIKPVQIWFSIRAKSPWNFRNWEIMSFLRSIKSLMR
jgi:hypothetical protein